MRTGTGRTGLWGGFAQVARRWGKTAAFNASAYARVRAYASFQYGTAIKEKTSLLTQPVANVQSKMAPKSTTEAAKNV